MLGESEIRSALARVLINHKSTGTLAEQTPRMIREQLSIDLCLSVSEIDLFKDKIKQWIIDSLDEDVTDFQSKKSGSNKSAAELRSIAKMVGVPPSFWSAVDKENAGALSGQLIDFCKSKQVPRADPEGLPTLREAKKYKAWKDANAELEGIDARNIVDSRKRKCREFSPLFPNIN